jgi:hypothetical protein
MRHATMAVYTLYDPGTVFRGPRRGVARTASAVKEGRTPLELYDTLTMRHATMAVYTLYDPGTVFRGPRRGVAVARRPPRFLNDTETLEQTRYGVTAGCYDTLTMRHTDYATFVS